MLVSNPSRIAAFPFHVKEEPVFNLHVNLAVTGPIIKGIKSLLFSLIYHWCDLTVVLKNYVG